MKYTILLTFTIFSFNLLYSQEICDNAIDDDGDGLIDLNDSECFCDTVFEIEGIIPNPDFSETTCCPETYSDVGCAEKWVIPSSASTDFFHLCGFNAESTGFLDPPEEPFPGGDLGYMGLSYSPAFGYSEYIAVCLDAPFEAGETYTMSLFVSRGLPELDIDLALYGSPDCSEIPWIGFDCPEGLGDWQLLANQELTLMPDGEWSEVLLTFTPLVEINAIAIGGGCDIPESGSPYFFLDNLTLIGEPDFSTSIVSEGSWCTEDLLLFATTTDAMDETFQWYKEGIALTGETESFLDPMIYGAGTFQVVYSTEDGCQMMEIEISNETTPISFSYEPFCFSDTTFFNNTTIYTDDMDVSWTWIFGDGETSSEENPKHVYLSGGTYTVQLIGAINDCIDTTELTLETNSITVDFLADTLEQCEPSTILFKDLSAPTVLIGERIWQIGDDIYDEITVNHTFEEAGSYTIVLTIIDTNGCSYSLTKADYIAIHPIPTPAIQASPNPTTYFNTTIHLAVEDVETTNFYEWWLPGAIPESATGVDEVSIKYQELRAGNYDVTLKETNSFNCYGFAELEIVVTNDQVIYAPNVFTPDGDSFNHYWKVYAQGIDPYDFHLQIFNRWGEIIWESFDLNGAWDGTYGPNEIVQNGVYIWTIRTKDLSSDKAFQFDGTVTVLR